MLTGIARRVSISVWVFFWVWCYFVNEELAKNPSRAAVFSMANTDSVLSLCATAQSAHLLGLNIKRMHRFRHLFSQLGLPSHPDGILNFLTLHAAMADGMRLPDAPYWTASQATFLRESLTQDSDWTELVDQLSLALRLGPDRADTP